MYNFFALYCVDDVLTLTVEVLVEMKSFNFPEGEEFWAGFSLLLHLGVRMGMEIVLKVW